MLIRSTATAGALLLLSASAAAGQDALVEVASGVVEKLQSMHDSELLLIENGFPDDDPVEHGRSMIEVARRTGLEMLGDAELRTGQYSVRMGKLELRADTATIQVVQRGAEYRSTPSARPIRGWTLLVAQFVRVDGEWVFDRWTGTLIGALPQVRDRDPTDHARILALS